MADRREDDECEEDRYTNCFYLYHQMTAGPKYVPPPPPPRPPPPPLTPPHHLANYFFHLVFFFFISEQRTIGQTNKRESRWIFLHIRYERGGEREEGKGIEGSERHDVERRKRGREEERCRGVVV